MHSFKETLFRKATIQDLPRLIELSVEFYKMTPWAAYVTVDVSTVTSTIVNHLYSSNSLVLIGEESLFIGTLAPCAINSEVVIAQEIAWYGKNGKASLQEFEDWAKEKGATMIVMSCLANEKEPAMRKLFNKYGYTAVESSLIKGVL